MTDSESAVRYAGQDGLAVITMVHEPYNLLGPKLFDPLLEALDRGVAEGCRAVVLRSGLRHFCAGADLEFLSRGVRGDAQGESAPRTSRGPAEILRRLETFPLPIVSSVHGVCLGGGFELALVTDFIVAARSARIGSVEVTLGLHPLMGAVQRITQRAGALRAKEITMLGRRYDPDTLYSWGLVSLVVDDDELEDATFTVARELANGPTVAHTATKALAYIAVNEGVAAADAAMADTQKPIWASADVVEGLRSFRANGPGLARFEGR